VATEVAQPEMKRSLTLTGVTVNAMALIAPGAFLWTTFQIQASQTTVGGAESTAPDMWFGLFFALILAFLTAYSYAELARIYPEAGAGSSYYFAEAAFLDKEKPQHQRYARMAKLTVGWISHLYYWIYPGIMVAFTATLAGYIYATMSGNTPSYRTLAALAIIFALIVGYIAYRGISGSTMTAIAINVIQIVALLSVSVIFIAFRLTHGGGGYELQNAAKVIIPHQFIHVVFQSTIAILLLVGFESVTALGAEALRPEKDIRRGVLISLAIQGAVCYLFEYFAANFAVGQATISAAASGSTPATAGYAAAASDSAPIGTMITNIGNSWIHNTGKTLALIAAFSVMLALIGTTLACLNTGVRITYVMGRDKEMPGLLGLLHGKYATPHTGVWILTGISAALGVFGVHTLDNLTQITLASNTGTFLVYGMTCLIALIAFASHHERNFGKHMLVPGLGLAMNVGELLGVVYLAIKAGGSSSHDAYIALAAVGIWILLGIVWVAVNSARHGRALTGMREPQPASVG
jgi:amino acid transporter